MIPRKTVEPAIRAGKWRMLHIVWQFNGEFGACNYRCEYCYYKKGSLTQHDFPHPVKDWRQAFRECFPNKRIVFYLSFGEPTIGKGFDDIMKMIGQERDWILHITSNLSRPLQWWAKLADHKLVRDGRFFVNASFHPTQTTIGDFLGKLLLLRSRGVECPVVIVMWPAVLGDFKRYFDVFASHGFLVHVRRFAGWFDGKWYPRAYTESERRFIARYADDATIGYMLNERNCRGKMSYAGSQYILLDENGDVWESPDSKGKRLGNVFERDVRLYDSPHPYSGRMCASVQGVAALLELGYPELEPNFVTSFARHGGVYRTPNGVHYKNLETDFNHPKIRKEYGFPDWKTKVGFQFCAEFVDRLYLLAWRHRGSSPMRTLYMILSGLYHYPPGHTTQEHAQLMEEDRLVRFLRKRTHI